MKLISSSDYFPGKHNVKLKLEAQSQSPPPRLLSNGRGMRLKSENRLQAIKHVAMSPLRYPISVEIDPKLINHFGFGWFENFDLKSRLLHARYNATKERIGSDHNHNLVVPFGSKTTQFRGPWVITIYPAVPFGGKIIGIVGLGRNWEQVWEKKEEMGSIQLLETVGGLKGIDSWCRGLKSVRAKKESV
ncbi:hypothetical protein IEQ34_017927 [Dendrobium chrysotoxum]|uniref:Uncharacterized protein n=1 Tax=Dendrobium chrysotoxum TaxID=161865 RepID=A0AAV7GDY1_DENCH|nr:hypothetical protein IEQ34_017927 [Dendrobium chrysotoxum]